MSDPTVLLKTLGVPMVHVDGDQQTASLQGLPTALAHGLPSLPGLPIGPFSCSSTPGRVDAPIDPQGPLLQDDSCFNLGKKPDPTKQSGQN